jgi:thioredoxin 1
MAGTILELTDQNWEAEVMASPHAVLVDFWAEWCVPCKALLPSIEAVAQQFQGRLKVAKLNVEDNEQVPFRYNITTLPTLMVFKKGQVAEQRIGLLSRDNLVKLLEPHLG